MKTTISLFLWCLVLGLAAFCASASFLLYYYDYQEFTEIILNYTNKKDWKGYFQEQVFSEQRFTFVRWLLPFVGLLYGLAFWLFLRYWRVWASRITEPISLIINILIQKIKNYIRYAERWEKVCALLIFGFLAWRSIYTIHQVEIQYDEAWTYNHFISKGLLVCLLSPNNNHILYTIFACFSDYLPLPHKFALRLPALLGAWAACWALYAFVRNTWGSRAAILSFAFFSFSSAIYFYALYARAYSWMYFFNVLQLWAFWKIAFGGEQVRYRWWLWVGASVAGLYSTPAYLYAFLGLQIALLFVLKGRQAWWFWLQYNAAILLITSFLYFPFLITNGFDVLAAAAGGENQPAADYSQFYSYIGRVQDICFTGQRWRSWLPLWLGTALVLVHLYYNWNTIRYRCANLLILLHIWMPAWMFLLSGVETPERIWTFLLIFWTLALAAWASHLPKGSKPLYIGLLAFFLGLWNGLWSSQQHFSDWSYRLDQAVRAEAEALLRLQPAVSECYIFARYDKPLLEYYFLINKRNIKIYMPFPESKDYRDFRARKYQTVLWDKDDYSPTAAEREAVRGYETVYENYRVRLLK